MIARIRRGVRGPQMNTDHQKAGLQRSGPTSAPLKRAILMICVCLVAGCGGALSGGSVLSDVWTPWDAPIVPPPTDMSKMSWPEGEVTEVSRDGSSLHFKVKRGVTPRMGAMVGLYVPMPRKPGPHYMWDESRELRVAEARVVGYAGDTCKAEIVNRTTNAPVSVGDKVIVKIP